VQPAAHVDGSGAAGNVKPRRIRAIGNKGKRIGERDIVHTVTPNRCDPDQVAANPYRGYRFPEEPPPAARDHYGQTA
jgi:hypothetical protein